MLCCTPYDQDGEILAFLGNNDVCGDSHWKENRLGKSVVQVPGLACSPLVYCCVGAGAYLLRHPHHQCGGSAGRARVPQTFCAGTNGRKPVISVCSWRQTPAVSATVSFFVEWEVGSKYERRYTPIKSFSLLTEIFCRLSHETFVSPSTSAGVWCSARSATRNWRRCSTRCSRNSVLYHRLINKKNQLVPRCSSWSDPSLPTRWFCSRRW